MMVSLDSARQWYPREEFLACNADHSQIAKLKRGENSIYPSVRWAIKKALLRAGDLYSEAKKTRYSESRNLEGADKTPGIRRSLLQITHHQASMPSYDRTADSALTPSRSLSENTIDQHIRHVPGAEVDQCAHCNDTQSKSNPSNETVSQWRSGMKIGELDDTQPSGDPTKSAETDVASVLSDKDDVASKSTELTASLGAESAVSREATEGTNPDPMGNEVDQNTVLQADNLRNSTKNTKSMTMDKVMESAITGGNEAKIRQLLVHFYDVNCKGKDGITPLLLAARYRHESVVRLLLEQGADPRARCDNGRTTLHWVGSIPEKPISETLIDLLLGYRPPFEAPDSGGVTPLMAACQNRDLLLTTRLIRHGADVRATNYEGRTALHYAASFGNAQMVSLLTDYGAEIEVRKLVGRTPLHCAAASQSDSSATVEQLLQAGANKEARTGSSRHTPLHLAILKHNEACVNCLLQSGAKIESGDKDAWRPLHFAAHHGQLKIMEALLHRDANIEAKTTKGWTALHIAAQNDRLDNLKALLDHGANIEATTNFRSTALNFAAATGHLDNLKALLDHGANIEAPTESGWTALHLAARNDRLEIFKTLLHHGANVEALTTSAVKWESDSRTEILYRPGWRLLHIAALDGRLEIVKALLEHGANIEAPTSIGRRPLHIAAGNGCLEIVKALLEHGANPTAKTTKLVGSKPSGFSMSDSVPSAQNRAIRALLKEAEKTWKESGKE